MNDFGKQDVRFLDIKTKQILKYHFHTYGNGSSSVFGKSVNDPNFILDRNPINGHSLIATYNSGYFEIYEIMTGKKLLKVLTNGYTLAFAHKHPWVFSGVGELWDYEKGIKIGNVKLADEKIPALDAKFTKDDSNIIYVDFGCPKRFDTNTKKVVKTCDFYSSCGLFFLTPDDQFLIGFKEGKGMVTYKKRYLKRSKLCLRVIGAQNLLTRQNICLRNSSVVDAAMAGNTLIVSDFEKIYIFKPFRNGVWY